METLNKKDLENVHGGTKWGWTDFFTACRDPKYQVGDTIDAVHDKKTYKLAYQTILPNGNVINEWVPV